MAPSSPSRPPLLETSALVIGYAMSRLDRHYLSALNLRTWKQAFTQAGTALGVRPASLKNLRDEFDPLHGNARAGWHGRPLRASRQRLAGELCGLSDAALLELVRRTLAHDAETLEAAIAPLAAAPPTHTHNVADRLLTGRQAEDFFLRCSQQIVGVPASDLIDLRLSAQGFDFAVRSRPNLALEIKGLRTLRGPILFTDREWSTAAARGPDYLLIVIGNLNSTPRPKLFPNPHATLPATCRYTTTLSASWSANVHITWPFDTGPPRRFQ